jgi:PAS domain S-box-containing protein
MDGEIRDVEISSTCINFNNKNAIQAFIRDITKRKIEEEKYRLLAENAKDIIIVYEEDGTINYINNSGHEILGIKRDNKNPINIEDLLPPGGKYLKPHDLIKNKDKDYISHKNRTEVISFQGEIIKLQTIASPVKLDNEKYGILIVARDITEMKQLEREIIHISERLRQQVSRDLHDDLNPHLIGIEALAQVLYMNLKKNQITEAEEAEKISTLINKAITKIHRLARGLYPIDLESSGIQTPLIDLIKLVRSLYGIECKFTYDESIIIEDITLAANLYYIAQEAAINAARHSGGSLITIKLKQVSNTLILSIEDNGYGMSKEKIYHSDKTSGMGLKIMKYRAEIIDGVFSMHKNKPSGTIISVNIPISILKSEGRISYGGKRTKTKQETTNIYS